MEFYTGSGDRGMTSLKRDKNVSKSDDRIHAMGELEELICQLGFIKLYIGEEKVCRELEVLQKHLHTLVESISDPYNKEYRLKEEELGRLEARIHEIGDACPHLVYEPLSGVCPLSGRIDLARSAARRAERWLISSDRKFGGQPLSKQYMNRIGDYLYVLARAADAGMISENKDVPEEEKPEQELTAELVVQEVLKKIRGMNRIDLNTAKILIEKIEQYAFSVGKNAVIAVCGPDGNPVAVHVMDGAFLISFDVAVKKAYTAVSVKMSTMELGKLVAPGKTFAGLDELEKDKMVFFGGGVPLIYGDQLIGGLGISGGTGEEDHGIAVYGQRILGELLQ